MTKQPPGNLTVSAVAGTPERIRWRERTYLVTEVHGRWIESDPWWSAAAARVAVAAAEPIALSRTIWRVEARGGRGSIVFDLAHDPAADAWSLVRIAD